MFAPFRGWFFDWQQVGDPSAVTSPPFDAIDAAEHDQLLQRSPYNVIRLLQPQGGDDSYAAAGQSLRSWISEGLLMPDPEPRFYLYEMEYLRDSQARRARGVVGALVVEPLGRRILPHEETMTHQHGSHLAAMREVAANLDPIMVLSSSPTLGTLLVPQQPPRLEFDAEGVGHRLYDLADPDQITAISEEVEAHGASIADGHHRYATALSYRRQRETEAGAGPWSQIMAMVAPAEGSGLHVGPFHRMFPTFPYQRGFVEELFHVSSDQPRPPDAAGCLTLVTSNGITERLTPRPLALTSLPEPWREASAAIARELLYPLLDITETDAAYEPNGARAVAAVAEGRFEAAVLTAPVSEHAIALASEEGIRFPQKTTYFTPKPRAGMVVRPLTG